MHAEAEGFVAGLRTCFGEVRGPRVQRRCEHLLLDILAIALLAVLCGAEDWPDIEEFGRRRADWPRGFLTPPNGISSHDTSRRVFGLRERQQFSAGLFPWTRALHEASGGKLIAVDGKTARRSGRKKSGLGALHLVTAWATQSGLTLGQVARADKSNEITALPELLKLLDLRGGTATRDSMGRRKEVAEQIRGRKGHYVPALKDNQPGRAEDMRRLFADGIENDFAGLRHTISRTEEKGHGRHERRTCEAIGIPAGHPQRSVWKQLSTLVVVTSCRGIGDKETWETRYYISSHRPDARTLAAAIRKQWGIENGQHWRLDVTFGEDVRRQQDRNGAADPAAVRRLALSLLRQKRTNKRGVKNKRLACASIPTTC